MNTRIALTMTVPAAIAVFCLTPPSLSATDSGDTPISIGSRASRWYLGPVAGQNQNFHSSGFKSFSNDAHCPTFPTGEAKGFYAGLSVQYFLQPPVRARTSIIARFMYDNRPASYATHCESSLHRVRTPDGELRELEAMTRHEAVVDYDFLNLELLFNAMIGSSKFGITVGPSIGYTLQADLEQVFKLLRPLNAELENGTLYELRDNNRTLVIQDGAFPASANWRIGLTAGLLYEHQVGKFLFVPHIDYDYALSKLSAVENLRVNALRAGIDIRRVF